MRSWGRDRLGRRVDVLVAAFQPHLIKAQIVEAIPKLAEAEDQMS